MTVNAGDIIQVDDYNDLATLVNKVVSDNYPASEYYATFTGASINNAAVCNAIFSKHETDNTKTGTGPFTLSPAPTNGDFIVVVINNVVRTGAAYTIDYNSGTIVFTSALTATDRVIVYNRTDHRFGWGGTAAVVPLVANTIIRASHMNSLIDRTNLMLTHIGSSASYARLENRPDLVIYASDSNELENTTNNTVIASNTHLTMDPTTADESTPVTYTTSISSWTDLLTGEFAFSFNNYQQARYFFNSGGSLHLDLSVDGEAGYNSDVWASVINSLTELIFNWEKAIDTDDAPYRGISNNIGFYKLTTEYQTIFTTANSGDIFSGYSGYQALLNVVIKAKYEHTGGGYFKVVFKLELDDSLLWDWSDPANPVENTMSANITFSGWNKKSTNLTDNTASLSVVGPVAVEEVTAFNDVLDPIVPTNPGP